MIQRYDIWPYQEEQCGPPYLAFDVEKYGSWISVEDLEAYLNNIKSSYIYVSDLKKDILGEN